uniref:Uncharacterized protein n=1 Tax=Pseudomonas syringae TaxID=317 RepID=I3W0H5_PSESX|nr:hypothetical protein [Pseudomonas syringae]
MRSDTSFGKEYERQFGRAGIEGRMSEVHLNGIVLGGNRAKTSDFRHGLKAIQTRGVKA